MKKVLEYTLKELRNHILRIIRVWSSFYTIRGFLSLCCLPIILNGKPNSISQKNIQFCLTLNVTPQIISY